MVKRKCGTCKFFKSAGVAGSGWCEHPQRVQLQDLVLVRRSELACRNGWDQDLWQPDEAERFPSQETDTELETVAVGSTEVTVRENDPPIEDQQSDTVIARGDVSELTTPVGRSHHAHTPKLKHNWPGSTRRNAAEPDEDRKLPYAATDAWRRRVTEAPKYDSHSRFTGSSWSRAEIERGKPGFTRVYENGNEARQTSPETARSWAGPSEQEPSNRQARQPPDYQGTNPGPVANETSQTAYGGFREQSNVAASDRQHEAPFVHTDVPGQSNGRDHPVASPDARQSTEPLPTDAVNEQLTFGSTNDAFSEALPSSYPKTSDTAERNSEGQQRSPFIHVDGPELGTGQFSAQPETSSREHSVSQQAPIDRAEKVASITRCCGTCRDFRRNSDGESGVCMNPYAFRDRTMVKCDQLACRSSIGVWWLPHDDFWLERADTLHHTRPTPHLDAALGLAGSSGSGRDSRTDW